MGCKASLAKGSPVYPEFNVKWLEDELDTLAGREETSFDITEETKSALKEQVIPYWKGRTVYDHISAKAPEKTLAAGDEGLLFHYYIDRSIGHISVNYEKVLKLGFSGIKTEIRARQALLSETQDDFAQKRVFYDALIMVADAAITFSHRYAALASDLAAQKDPQAYRSLIVRVAGYSDYFISLSKDLQDEIIMRTAHGVD